MPVKYGPAEDLKSTSGRIDSRSRPYPLMTSRNPRFGMETVLRAVPEGYRQSHLRVLDRQMHVACVCVPPHHRGRNAMTHRRPFQRHLDFSIGMIPPTEEGKRS